jgi:hypothetical protein
MGHRKPDLPLYRVTTSRHYSGISGGPHSRRIPHSPDRPRVPDRHCKRHGAPVRPGCGHRKIPANGPANLRELKARTRGEFGRRRWLSGRTDIGYDGRVAVLARRWDAIPDKNVRKAWNIP